MSQMLRSNITVTLYKYSNSSIPHLWGTRHHLKEIPKIIIIIERHSYYLLNDLIQKIIDVHVRGYKRFSVTHQLVIKLPNFSLHEKI
jgi:hypothetical protein